MSFSCRALRGEIIRLRECRRNMSTKTAWQPEPRLNPCYFTFMDVVDLRNFYAQHLGVVARRFVGRGIRARWKDTRGQRVLGVGYATPYLGLFREEAER